MSFFASSSRRICPPAARAMILAFVALAISAPAYAQVFLTAPQDLWKAQPKALPAPAYPKPAPVMQPAPAFPKPLPAMQPAPAYAKPLPVAQPAPAYAKPLPVAQPAPFAAPTIPQAAPARPVEPAQNPFAGGKFTADQTQTRPTVIRHLTNNVQGYRLSGEIGSSEWPIYMTDVQARRKLQFQLGYLAAVSVMPEASTLTLIINDEIVGETPIKAVGAVKTVVFDIPSGLMRPGFNSVRLSTEQRHRVDCSTEATYELWTQIDPIKTGILLSEADASIDSLADLAALLPDEQGALRVRAVLPANPSPGGVERILHAAQLISIVGRFEQPVVDVGPMAPGQYGVNLLVGTAAELAKEVRLGVFGAVDRPRAVVLPATQDRRTTIVITGATAAQVDEAMKQFLVATTPKGSTAGLRAAAAFPGFRMEGGQRVRLRDLGVISEEFTGRLFRVAFNIIMPPDFYAADYGRATLRLAGGYASGLTSRAQIVLNVNDRTAVSLSLLKSSGEVFKDTPLPLPLGFLRPGLNRVEIEAHLPSGEDDSCDPLAAIHAKNRYLFLDSTEIEIPAIARVARMPDLAVTATGGFPFAGSVSRPKLYLPSFEQKSIGAAATLVAHLAIAAGRPIDFEITETPPAKGKGPTLAVAPLDSLEPSLLGKLDMPEKELRQAWKSQLEENRNAAENDTLLSAAEANRNRMVLQNNFPMACRPSKGSPGYKAAQANGFAFPADKTPVGTIHHDSELAHEADVDAEPRDLFKEWDAKVRGESRWAPAVFTWVRKVREWSASKFTDAARRIGSGFEVDEALVSSQSSLAIGQNILGDAREDVWTVFTAPNPETLAEAVACLIDPRVSRQISGRVSVLDVSEAKVNVAPVTEAHFVVTQSLSVGNIRLIAAGWLSLHSFSYVAGALVLGLLLAVATRWFVVNVGRKSH